MQPAKAKNPTLALTFLNDEVMTTEFMDGMFAVDPRPPAWLESYEKAAADPIVKAFGDYGKQGVPIPCIPQMATVFTEGGLAMYKVAAGANPTTTHDGGRRLDQQANTSADWIATEAHATAVAGAGAGGASPPAPRGTAISRQAHPGRGCRRPADRCFVQPPGGMVDCLRLLRGRARGGELAYFVRAICRSSTWCPA